MESYLWTLLEYLSFVHTFAWWISTREIKSQPLFEYIDEEKNANKTQNRAEYLPLDDKECVTVKFHMAKRVVGYKLLCNH